MKSCKKSVVSELNSIRMSSASRRTIINLGVSDDSSSGPSSPIVDRFDNISMEDSVERRRSRGGSKTDNALRKLAGKEDASSLFLNGFDPSKGRKAKLKLTEKAYKESSTGIIGKNQHTSKTRNNKKDALYDAKGALLMNGIDVCDCLIEDCPGCHFPCPRCKSSKCGHECRNNRKWVYDSVEIDGMPNTIRFNKFKSK